jgi:hypothetical protein
VLQRMRDLVGRESVMTWRRFVASFMATFIGGIAAFQLFVLLVDPYNVIPFSLPIERRIVSISQRHMYPQIVRSRRFDSFIIGSSTSRLLDPELLNGPFQAHFANLAMDSMMAWEQRTMADLFLREVGAPKVLIVGIDGVWCDQQADRNPTASRRFPDWLYDDNRWNDYLYQLNSGTVEIAGRLIGYQFGLYRERVRIDGFEVFTPPERDYDLVRARNNIWRGEPRPLPPDLPPPPLSDAKRQELQFPALRWLDEILAPLPASTVKILSYMPVHVAAQPRPGTVDAAIEAECKARIASIARVRGAKVVDWRIASPITTADMNYWDSLHFRLPIAQRIARDLPAAILAGRDSNDAAYRLVVR